MVLVDLSRRSTRFRGMGFAVAAVMALSAGAAHAEDRAFCAQRPGKATPSCTLDPGRVQVEVDLADRSSGDGDTDLIVASPQVRVGVTPSTELQLTWTPYERVTAPGQRASGVGDVVAGAKVNLTGNASDFDLALLPFVKLPTAAHAIGNGHVEGGLIVPTTVGLPGGWSLGLSPEFDLNLNDSGSGRHLAGAAAASLGHGLGPNLNLAVELWTAREFAPGGATQASADLMLAWTVPHVRDLQLDAGVDFGLTSATPDREVYVGVAKRF